MRLIFTGATGFIGRAAILSLANQGHRITALVRNEQKAANLPCRLVQWSAGQTQSSILDQALSGADAVVHLAGEPIAAHRWTKEEKQRIYDSRILGTREIVQSIQRLPQGDRPKTLISASAIGIYGDRGDERLVESSAPGHDFLAHVAKDWEHEALAAESLGVRVVLMRNGAVLGRSGGMLAKMRPVVFGKGRQWMSWVHLTDVIRFIALALVKDSWRGAFNLTAPNPVQNKDFAKSLAKAKGSLLVFNVPAFAIRIALGEMAQIVLDSARAIPEKTTNSGFVFSYEAIDGALADILAPSRL